MTRRVLVALTVLAAAGIGYAEWQPLGSGTGSARISVLKNNVSQTVFEVSIPGLDISPVTAEGNEYSKLSLPGDVFAVLEQGRPEVPKVSVLLAIPTGARVTARAEVLETRTLSVAKVYPLQPPLLDGDRPGPLVIDSDFYDQDISYPGFAAKVIETGVWRDLDVANLQVYPVQVNPARREIAVASRIRVSVDYSGGAYPTRVAGWMIPTYASYIDNFGSIRLAPQTDYTAGVRYLVFCHQDWASHTWLRDSLLGWVQKRGYDLRVITKSSFTATEVKDSIKQEYDRHSPALLQYVLLVGEYSQIPTGSYTGVGRSDFYYADIAPYPTGDKYPEINLARLSPSSADDLENQVRKILKYQKQPASGAWLERMTFVAHREQYPGKYSGCVRGVYHMPKPYWQPDIDTIMGQYKNNADVANAVNAGTGILAYRGHGDAQIWAGWCGSNWSNAEVAALDNDELTPVTQHWACICGDISEGECHTEAWMRKYPGGAVSALGATQASYTLPNHGQCSTVVRAMTDTWTITVPGVRDYAGPVFSVSGQMSYMDAYLAKYWPDYPYYRNIWMYLTLGDPAMPVWAGTPGTPVVSYPDTIPLGAYDFNVQVAVSGQPVEDALVCAWKQGEFYVSGRTDAAGNAGLAVNAASAGEFTVTVSEGHARHSTPGAAHTPILPYEGTATAADQPPHPGQFIVTLDTGAVRLSVCGIGSIGYDEPPEAEDAGSGFQVPKNSPSTLFFGSLMAGTSPGYLVDHHFGQPANGPTNQDWLMTDSFRFWRPPVPADVRWRGKMSDQGHPSSQGLEVTQDWHMNADGGYEDWCIGDFTFTNNGTSSISGLYVGMIGDFDIGSDPRVNVAASNESQRSVWMRQSSSQYPCAGLLLLHPTTFANLTAVDHARYVYPNDTCMSDGQKFRILDGTISQRSSDRDYDWSVAATAGPFELRVGEEQRVVFAVVGGTTEADFAANADSAQSWFDANLLGVAERPAETAAGQQPFFLSPNPFTRGTFVNYFSGLQGEVELLAFDPTGRIAERVVFDARQGSGRYFWQPRNLAKGVYFLKFRTTDSESGAKVLLMD
ncbi:MAG: hypothetical protein JSU73_12315 [candidate division WOR-3 bacterium]|nr:MAG: hypothetical protein JSU73_12315 [candidate division WOR-3 bacterium]